MEKVPVASRQLAREGPQIDPPRVDLGTATSLGAGLGADRRQHEGQYERQTERSRPHPCPPSRDFAGVRVNTGGRSRTTRKQLSIEAHVATVRLVGGPAPEVLRTGNAAS